MVTFDMFRAMGRDSSDLGSELDPDLAGHAGRIYDDSFAAIRAGPEWIAAPAGVQLYRGPSLWGAEQFLYAFGLGARPDYRAPGLPIGVIDPEAGQWREIDLAGIPEEETRRIAAEIPEALLHPIAARLPEATLRDLIRIWCGLVGPNEAGRVILGGGVAA